MEQRETTPYTLSLISGFKADLVNIAVIVLKISIMVDLVKFMVTASSKQILYYNDTTGDSKNLERVLTGEEEFIEELEEELANIW